ncbi:10068_t:CDS:2 [Ambispora leptoticha]|uniref:10068_t:CDS:1 n=1 Tax=Ambispora leptoticha TaxID=144679 RepID=A0A9N9AN36_9GLOM|nr:10068_t:CDS:2 [Ambispora leptoticha]
MAYSHIYVNCMPEEQFPVAATLSSYSPTQNQSYLGYSTKIAL